MPNFDFKQVGELAMGVMQAAPSVIKAVQTLRGHEPGPVKQTAVINGLGGLLRGTEVVAGEDLFDDPEALAATADFINAMVLYKNRMAAARAKKEGIAPPPGVILPSTAPAYEPAP